jgi:hypothetical protein
MTAGENSEYRHPQKTNGRAVSCLFRTSGEAWCKARRHFCPDYSQPYRTSRGRLRRSRGIIETKVERVVLNALAK